jgi:uncharacterized membrane protein
VAPVTRFFSVPFILAKDMAVLTRQKLKEDGLNPTYAAASSAGDSFNNKGDEFLHVKNADTVAHTVTVDSSTNSIVDRYYGKLTKADVAVSVPAGGSMFIGPFPVGGFGSAPAITYSGVTALTVAVLVK